MITTWSAVCATSESTWLETRIVRALGGQGAEEVAQPPDPGGIEPVRRLVQHEHLRIAEQRGGEPEALAHAERVALHAPLRGRGQLDEREHLLDPRRGQPGGGRLHAQVVSPGAAGMDLARLEHGADAMERPVELGIGDAEDGRAAGIGMDEPEHRAERRRLAGAVRAEEARDRARLDPEAEPGDRLRLPEALAEAVDLDHDSVVT